MVLQRRSRVTAAQRAQSRGVLAAVVVARRQELSLSQQELADLAGVARGTVLSLEAGRTVSLDVLLSLLQVLGLHLELARGAVVDGIEASRALALHYGLVGNDSATDSSGNG